MAAHFPLLVEAIDLYPHSEEVRALEQAGGGEVLFCLVMLGLNPGPYISPASTLPVRPPEWEGKEPEFPKQLCS